MVSRVADHDNKKGLSNLAQNKNHRNKKEKIALIFRLKFLIMLKTADKNKVNPEWFTLKNRRFSSFLCGFLAATSLSVVPLYADENEFTSSASKLDSPLIYISLISSPSTVIVAILSLPMDITALSPPSLNIS